MAVGVAAGAQCDRSAVPAQAETGVGAAADRMASTATPREPVLPFFMPTGMGRPLASCRCT
ncbi:hypothetical protein BFF78_27065 [Streptomyces fodineus]|uniref:Uncharacterized protein n=1 Tax=Streptomyces fodineus TaxID=1904616 RepID=A0A1D7YF49_9ACTN|nr:hypothetical protein BFF78_27065 [Streptomyces fodineus]